MQVTMLGTGTSHGVPTIDCMITNYRRCPQQVCRKAEANPRHRRSRASALVRVDGVQLLLDTSQDFRQQMLDQRVQRIDAVLYTHGHADHIYGLPDIRSYSCNQGGPIDIYGSRDTLDILHGAFDYVFRPPVFVGGGIPELRPHVMEAPQIIQGVDVIPVPVEHGPLRGCQGYRIGDIAYVPDVKVIPPESLALLQNLDILIIDCLRITPHATHLSLEESLMYAESLRPRRCLLTHMAHDIDYELEEARLPDWIRFAYDGLVVTL